MTDNTLKTNNTQQVEPELPPLTKEEEEMLLEEAKNWKEPEYDDYDAYNTYETSCDVGFPPALKKKPSAEEYAKQIDKTGFEKKGLYKGIVQVEDDFRRIRLIKAYRERAKELGGTQMAKFFDEMLKTAKKEWMEGEKMGMKKKTMPASGTENSSSSSASEKGSASSCALKTSSSVLSVSTSEQTRAYISTGRRSISRSAASRYRLPESSVQ